MQTSDHIWNILGQFWKLNQNNYIRLKKKGKHGMRSRETAGGKVDDRATFHLTYYSKVFGAEWEQPLNSGFKMTFNRYQKWSDKEEMHLS